MIKLKKFIIVILIVCILFPRNIYAMSKESAGDIIASYAEDLVNNYADEFIYSSDDEHRHPAYELKKTSGTSSEGVSFKNKYGVDYVGFVSFVVHNSIGIGGQEYTEFVVPSSGLKGNYFEEISPKPDIKNLKRGDIIWNSHPHVMIYIGDGKVAHSIRDGISIDKLDSFNDGSTDYVHVARIKDSTVATIDENNCNKIFGSAIEERDEYGKFYGTTKGHYGGTYTIGEWLFDKFVGFFDYLVGIITYIFKAQFLGWGNIIEELVNYSINYATKMENVTVEKGKENSGENSEEGSAESLEEDSEGKLVEDNNEQIVSSPGTGNLYTPSATNTMWSNNRINIEDIIYNRVPLLDVNFLDVKLERYKKIEESKKAQASDGEEIQVISEDSIVYALRANIAKWYIVIRQVCIIVLLLLLIYLGIRLAISTVASDKAKYKGMLVAWLTSFIVVFCIHYYMMIVININEVLVDIFAEASQNAIEDSDNGTGSQSIYDTIRTRAYSLKLSEGVPATIFYLVLIYFLIRFLFIYIKRYFTIMILAIMGPIMSLKNCFDKLSTGKSKSMSKWMYDFALNVFLQTIHAIIYCIFMVIAFDLATYSIAGFIMALIVLNFIFKSEKIFMKIFNFEGRASSLRDVNENKNYFAEAYKVGVGATMFGKSALKFGFGAVAGSGKFLGEKALSSAQLGVSMFRRFRGDTPIDLSEKFNDWKENSKNGVADKLNDVIERKTGKRNLRLDLHNIKKQDPILYKKTKEALKLKKDLKWKTLKRTFGDSTKSIRYMAELMMGIPMLVIDTKSGVSALADASSGLKGMGARKKEYGYRRTIKGKRGNIATIATSALNAATFGGVNATKNSVDKFKKERKKLVNNNKLVESLNKANMLEIEIEKEVERMIANGDKNIEDIMKNALDQVMSSSKVKGFVGEYMLDKGITKFGEKDINEIIDNMNKEMFTKNVDKAINEYMKRNNKESLNKEDFDLILDEIGKKVEKGVSEILNDNTLMDNIRPDVKNIHVDSTKIAEDYVKENNIFKLDDNDIKEIQRRVDEEVKKEIESHVYKDIKKARDEFMKQEKLEELSIEQVKELLTSEASHSSFGIETTEEIRKEVSDLFTSMDITKSDKILDKKQVINAIEDVMLGGKAKDNSKLSKMMRELKTLREKTKNDYNKTIVDIGEFKKVIKEKLK